MCLCSTDAKTQLRDPLWSDSSPGGKGRSSGDSSGPASAAMSGAMSGLARSYSHATRPDTARSALLGSASSATVNPTGASLSRYSSSLTTNENL